MKLLIWTLLGIISISNINAGSGEKTTEMDFKKLMLPGFQVVSDFDDTMKRSHVAGSTWRMVGRAFLPGKVFKGVPELYTIFNEQYNGLYILSASPVLVKELIEESIEDMLIDDDHIFTRMPTEWSSSRKFNYKVGRIEGVIADNQDKLILIGDNVEVDPQIYTYIKSRKPDRVEAIYIRKMENKPLPAGVIGFTTVFEVAAREYAAKRISYEQVEEIANAILNTAPYNMRRVLPYFKYCPTQMKEFTPVLNPELYELEFLVQIKVTDYCRGKSLRQ